MVRTNNFPGNRRRLELEDDSIVHLLFQLESVIRLHVLMRISAEKRTHRTWELVRSEYEPSTNNWDQVANYLLPDNGRVKLVHGRLEPVYEFVGKTLDSSIRGFGPGITKILEVGCGEGYYLKHIRQNAPDIGVYGIDLCHNRIRKLLGRGYKQDVAPCIGCAEKLPFADDSFDIAYTCYALEQMPYSVGQALKEMHRVVRRGVILVEPFYSIQNIFGKLNNWNSDFVRDIPLHVEQSGFQITSTRRLSVGDPLNVAGLLVAEK